MNFKSFDKKKISFPGKTFLFGEYAVLDGAPAVLLNTHPRFVFLVEKTKSRKGSLSFHSQSPAGKWLKKYPVLEEMYHIQTLDPYTGKGGFGLSSAEFNLLYFLSLPSHDLDKKNLLNRLWKSYQDLHFSCSYKVSGADVVSQWLGGDVCMFFSQPFEAFSIKWPFVDLEFFILRTGRTLNTWEHLKRQLIKQNYFQLKDIAKRGVGALRASKSGEFISAIKDYWLQLRKQNLAHPETQKQIDKMQACKKIVAIKGCGALGAESIIVFFRPEDKKFIKTKLSSPYPLIGIDDLTKGISIKII